MMRLKIPMIPMMTSSVVIGTIRNVSKKMKLGSWAFYMKKRIVWMKQLTKAVRRSLYSVQIVNHMDIAGTIEWTILMNFYYPWNLSKDSYSN